MIFRTAMILMLLGYGGPLFAENPVAEARIYFGKKMVEVANACDWAINGGYQTNVVVNIPGGHATFQGPGKGSDAYYSNPVILIETNRTNTRP